MMNLPELDIKKIAVIVLFSFAVLYTDAAFLFKKQFSSLRATGKKIEQLQKAISTVSKELEKMNEEKARAKKENQGGGKTLISEEQIPSLLHIISNFANDNKVKIMQMRPVKDTAVQSPGPGTQIALSIIMDVSCSYHNFGKFINDLENAGQFMAIQEMRIMNRPDTDLEQSIYLILKTYVKK
ncbi:MAG: hypothetical protein C4540_05305 [Candidatus Omnitrophota bacterium]|jgi:Tfp pilus assembly protein PilO|nr:MAG: hypothetical protein C4540_05305 [Candidatus Omnitrophota bacterium]